jgi:hypothetical protein
VSLLQELELEPILESIVDSGSRQLRAEKAVLKGKKDVVRAEDVLAQLAEPQQLLQKAAGEPLDTGPTIAATQVRQLHCVQQVCCVVFAVVLASCMRSLCTCLLVLSQCVVSSVLPSCYERHCVCCVDKKKPVQQSRVHTASKRACAPPLQHTSSLLVRRVLLSCCVTAVSTQLLSVATAELAQLVQHALFIAFTAHSHQNYPTLYTSTPQHGELYVVVNITAS